MLGAVRRTFLSTPSARRATQVAFLALPDSRISIHALREEGDGDSSRKIRVAYISIHALREEGDTGGMPRPRAVKVFLSTPSARRATSQLVQAGQVDFDFYPRPPRGGRLARRFLAGSQCPYFYPRPPRGGRPAQAVRSSLTWRFLSTPSARRATGNWVARLWACSISIHALREEGDIPPCRSRRWATYFYPRPPRGGRRRCGLLFPHWRSISIHALREEGDLSAANTPAATSAFLSTPSARRATCERHQSPADRFISIHALREEGDIDYLRRSPLYTHFYPRPPRGGRLFPCR